VLKDYIIYELHVGTFSEAGTFDGVRERLFELRQLGVTAIELMPVAQFPGGRNWGYDGVLPFAVQNSYGGPEALKRLVDACHGHGLAVILDVVYNHLGPEGNYLREFGPYFTGCYKTPWGEALNFDSEESDHVRRYFIENALYWLRDFHIDALRLDAVHAIRDFSATPFLQELGRAVKQLANELGGPLYLIGESDLNDARLIRPEMIGGVGLDAQWADDFHHCLHVLLTGEQGGYYQDFGGAQQMAKILNEGYAYTGEYSPFRKRRHGNVAWGTEPHQLVVCAQNHDQIGNRMLGERLSSLVDFERLKLAAGITMLSPFLPMLFMGEEYGEEAPFQYFISHSDRRLVKAVREGRQAEFAAFAWAGEVPDPAAKESFERCKLRHESWRTPGRQKLLREFYRELIRLRKVLHKRKPTECPVIRAEAHGRSGIVLRYTCEAESSWFVFNFDKAPSRTSLPLRGNNVELLLDSSAKRWGGPGSASVQAPCDYEDTAVEIPALSFAVLRTPV